MSEKPSCRRWMLQAEASTARARGVTGSMIPEAPARFK